MNEELVEGTLPHATARDRKIITRRVVIDGRSTARLWRQGIEPSSEHRASEKSIFRTPPARAA